MHKNRNNIFMMLRKFQLPISSSIGRHLRQKGAQLSAKRFFFSFEKYKNSIEIKRTIIVKRNETAERRAFSFNYEILGYSLVISCNVESFF